jgi:predicted Rossmann-fold nucleotide-binding protein
VAFLKEADAVALFPGGFGTLDEAMETMTLLQTGKHSPLPLVLIDEPGGTYWTRWLKFMGEELLAEGYIDEGDFDLFECVDSVDAAVERIERFYRRYHSMRYVNKKVVLRMSSPLSSDAVQELNREFADILRSAGSITMSGPLPGEADEPELAYLPRLILDFNFQSFGRFRELINAINDL